VFNHKEVDPIFPKLNIAQVRTLLAKESIEWAKRKDQAEHGRDALPVDSPERHKKQQWVEQCAVYESHSRWLLAAINGEVPIPYNINSKGKLIK